MDSLWKIFLLCLCLKENFAQYQANFSSLDKRPLPLWYDESKFGIFTHWGVYSVPAFSNEWFWARWQNVSGTNPKTQEECQQFMATHYKPGTTYPDLARQFTAIDFNATTFANIIKSSGARYFVITSKHHEGFTLWPSDVQWNWNAVDVGPARDLLGELRDAILKVGGIHWGTYFSLLEWFHPFFLSDHQTHRQDYPNAISYPQLIDLVTNYKPDLIWADGDWNFNYTYWRSEEFLAWLYNESPVKDSVVVNDRWGDGATCKHGGYFTCHDKYNPGKLLPYKWEDANTVDMHSWGFRRTMVLHEVNSLNTLVSDLVMAISTGGNYLLNIGPDHNGRVLPIFEERLRDMGTFVNAHEDAIFTTKPWIWQNDTADGKIWYTSRLRNDNGLDPYRLYNNQTKDNTIIYAFVLDYPDDNIVNFYHVKPTPQTIVTLFGANGQNISMPYTQPFELNGGIQVNIGGLSVKKFPSPAAFAFKIEYAADQDRNPLEE